MRRRSHPAKAHMMMWSPPDGMTMQESLDQFGIAVVPNVLDEQSVQTYKNDVFAAFEHLTSEWDTPFMRAGTHEQLRVPARKMFASHAQLFQYPPSLGQSQSVWNIRQDPRVVQVFADVHGVPTTELLTSFDGVSMLPPPEVIGIGWQRGEWLHADTSYHKPRPCVQGFVNLIDVHEGDATLTALLGSHKLFGDVPLNMVPDKNFTMLKTVPGLREWYEDRGCKQVRVQAPAGSVVLWDTKTIHSGCNPVRGRANASWRLVVYVCMMPRSTSSPKSIKRRIDMFERGRMSNHYAAAPSMFAKLPRTYGASIAPVKPLPYPQLSELGRKLVGY